MTETQSPPGFRPSPALYREKGGLPVTRGVLNDSPYLMKLDNLSILFLLKDSNAVDLVTRLLLYVLR